MLRLLLLAFLLLYKKCEIVERKVMLTTPVTIEYSLTETGRDFEQVSFEMREWKKNWL